MIATSFTLSVFGPTEFFFLKEIQGRGIMVMMIPVESILAQLHVFG